MLFGAVSISNSYHPASRRLIVSLLQNHRDGELAGLVTPQTPYRAKPASVPAELDQLSRIIADLEPDGKGIPILLKQYMKSGGRVLAFNVDRAFANALDALVLVDLKNAPAKVRRLVVQPGVYTEHQNNQGRGDNDVLYDCTANRNDRIGLDGTACIRSSECSDSAAGD